MTSSIPDEPTTYKLCPKCEREYPATREYFAFQKNALTTPCRTCRREYGRRYEAEQRNERREIHREYERKYARTHREQRRQSSAKYRAAHREAINAKHRLYDITHKEKRKKYNELHREERLQKQSIYLALRKEERRQYRILHRMEARLYAHKRRARKRAAHGSYTTEQIQEQYKRQKNKCYYCRKKVKWGNHHIDHVIPLSRGGGNDISNLVITCPTCNLKKNDKLPHEWPEGGRLM